MPCTCLAHALAGCRMALVGTGWTVSHLVSLNERRNNSSPLVEAPFLGLHVDSFQSGVAFAGCESPDH